MFGLFQKQTLRQGFEDEQPRETLVGNRGVRQRKEEALQITTQNNRTNAFVMLTRAVHPSVSVLSELSSLIWNWVFPTVMGGLNKWLRERSKTDIRRKCWGHQGKTTVLEWPEDEKTHFCFSRRIINKANLYFLRL